mmetsp:Transcript_15226/g.57462  ORF Transcript_15226/g.57462 Transcript_15226/m.57462 type:complete len:489 (-) Transcript_15226:1269-2735(-)
MMLWPCPAGPRACWKWWTSSTWRRRSTNPVEYSNARALASTSTAPADVIAPRKAANEEVVDLAQVSCGGRKHQRRVRNPWATRLTAGPSELSSAARSASRTAGSDVVPAEVESPARFTAASTPASPSSSRDRSAGPSGVPAARATSRTRMRRSLDEREATASASPPARADVTLSNIAAAAVAARLAVASASLRLLSWPTTHALSTSTNDTLSSCTMLAAADCPASAARMLIICRIAAPTALDAAAPASSPTTRAAATAASERVAAASRAKHALKNSSEPSPARTASAEDAALARSVERVFSSRRQKAVAVVASPEGARECVRSWAMRRTSSMDMLVLDHAAGGTKGSAAAASALVPSKSPSPREDGMLSSPVARADTLSPDRATKARDSGPSRGWETASSAASGQPPMLSQRPRLQACSSASCNDSSDSVKRRPRWALASPPGPLAAPLGVVPGPSARGSPFLGASAPDRADSLTKLSTTSVDTASST